MTLAERLLAFLGAALAAAGVALAAYAAHVQNSDLLRTAAAFLLVHGVAVVAVLGYGWTGKSNTRGLGALLLAGGTALFTGDLVSRALQDRPLFPDAAPVGGGAMIAAWIVLAFVLLAG